MISGIYYVEFSSNSNMIGSGLAVINQGDVNGGDLQYLYRGRFDAYAGQAKASIEVTHYRGEPNSVFGPLRSFTLELIGKVEDQQFDVQGGILGVPNHTIRIVGRKVSPLYERAIP